ncbi:MAG: DUF433 domain-containing protein [Candidatus Roizmanbacteria bacterium]|nr:DUF433 domain-containing protein [Candidatus Roizmanbacteria bacterium]
MNTLKQKRNNINGLDQIITINPKIQGGVPVIANSRVRVVDVVFLYKKKNISPEDIAIKYYTYLSLYQINKSIQWYELNHNKYEGLDL